MMMSDDDNMKKVRERILNSIFNRDCIQLKIFFSDNARPFYYKGCVLKYDKLGDFIWFKDWQTSIPKKFLIFEITNVDIINHTAFSTTEINNWIERIPKN